MRLPTPWSGDREECIRRHDDYISKAQMGLEEPVNDAGEVRLKKINENIVRENS